MGLSNVWWLSTRIPDLGSHGVMGLYVCCSEAPTRIPAVRDAVCSQAECFQELWHLQDNSLWTSDWAGHTMAPGYHGSIHWTSIGTLLQTFSKLHHVWERSALFLFHICWCIVTAILSLAPLLSESPTPPIPCTTVCLHVCFLKSWGPFMAVPGLYSANISSSVTICVIILWHY